MTKAYLIIAFIGLWPLSILGQSININAVEVKSGAIVVHYVLEDTNPQDEFQVSLFSSKDDFAAPLTKVSGDIGSDVLAGPDKKITWSIGDELGNFSGELSFEIRARIYIPFVKLTNFDTQRKYKRGKNYPLTWTSGNMGGQVDIELYHGKDRISGDRNIPNTGKYDWAILPSVKSGDGYTLRFTNTKNREDFVVTKPFSIVARTPFIIKFGGGLLLAGAGATAVLLSSSPNGPKDLPENPGLPSTK